jgi:small-conductance mechanosensitive channel
VQATPSPNAPPLSNAPWSSHATIIVQGYETAIALVAGFVVWRLTYAAIDRFFARRLLLRHPRITTYVAPIKSISGFVVLLVTGLILLNIWDVNIGPAVWSAGAITAVLAFGAQWIVRDLLAGYSIFAENQFDVGDRIEITTGINSQIAGVVEAIGLRTTRLIDRYGRTVFIPNGNIYATTNLSKGVRRLEIVLTLPWRGSVDAMKREILKDATASAIEAKIDADGVKVSLDDFDTNKAVFRIAIRTPLIDVDEGSLRERIAAALQAKGWFNGDPPTPPSAAPSNPTAAA